LRNACEESLSAVTASGDTSQITLNPYLWAGSPRYTFEARVRLQATNNGTHDITARAGVGTTMSIAPADGAWFEYTNADTTWHFKTRDASGTAEDTDTGVAHSTSWMRARIYCDGNGAIYAYLDGTLVATHTTVSAAGLHTPRFAAAKTVGSGTTRQLRVGYCHLVFDINR